MKAEVRVDEYLFLAEVRPQDYSSFFLHHISYTVVLQDKAQILLYFQCFF